MRIGVTGATGFLGSHVVRRLVADGHDVVGLRRQSPTEASEQAVEWVVGDLTDRAAVDRLVRRCDAVVHSAAFIRYGRSFAVEHERVNVVGTSVVTAASTAAGVDRLVHVSSVAAVAPLGGAAPADETAEFDLRGLELSYHASKRQAETIVQAAVANGLDAVVVNPASLHGPHGREFRGAQLIEGVKHRRIVPCFSGGSCIVHVEDAAAGVVAALTRGRTGERYILGGENRTWRGFAEIAAHELRLRRTFVRLPTAVTATASLTGVLARDAHVAASRFLYYDSAKAERELGYRFRPYREIVREYATRTGGAT